MPDTSASKRTSRTECAPIGTRVLRPPVRELDAQRLPRGAANLLQRLVPDGDGGVVEVRGAGCRVPVDGVAEEHVRRSQVDQDRDCAAIVQVKMQQERAQRLAHGGRVAHQIADGAEAAQVEALADEKAEVVAVRRFRALRHQATERCELDPVLGIAERRQRDAGTGERKIRGDPQRLEDVRNRSNGTDPDFAWGRGQRRGPAVRLRSRTHPVIARRTATLRMEPLRDGLGRSCHPAASGLPADQGPPAAIVAGLRDWTPLDVSREGRICKVQSAAFC